MKGGQEFLAPLLLFYCAHALANILVLLAEGAVGCQEVFALVLALVNISLLLPLPLPLPLANQGQLGRQEGLSPCEGECTHQTSSRFLSQSR